MSAEDSDDKIAANYKDGLVDRRTLSVKFPLFRSEKVEFIFIFITATFSM